MSTVEGDRHNESTPSPSSNDSGSLQLGCALSRPPYQPIAASCFSNSHLSQIYGQLALLTSSFLQENSTRLSSSLSMAKRFSSFRRRSPVDRCVFPQSFLSLLNSHLPVSLLLKYVHRQPSHYPPMYHTILRCELILRDNAVFCRVSWHFCVTE